MYPLKQSTAITVPIFVHDANGDAVTGLVDAGFTKRLSKNGGAFGAMTVTITEMENGWYSVPLSTAHTDTLGILSLTFTHASSKQINLQFRVSARIADDLMQETSISTTAGAVDTVTTVTNAVTLPAIPTNWITTGGITDGAYTAAKFAANSLDGKGDWNIGKTGYALSASGVDAIWDEDLLIGHAVADSAAIYLKNCFGDTQILTGTRIPDTISLANINAEVDTALADIGLDHLVGASVADTDVVDNSIVAKLVDSTAVTADFTNYDWTTDSLRALRDWVGDGTNLTEAGGTGDHLTAIDVASIGTDVINAAAIAADAVTELRSIVSGTADAGGSTTTMIDAARTEANDIWNYNWILFTSGAVANQCRLITDFDAASDTVTFAPPVAASVGAGITYEILPAGSIDLQSWLGTNTAAAVPNALVAGAVDADVSAMQAGTVTAAAVATGAIDADALATDAVNEIRDAILPEQNQTLDNITFLWVAASDGRTPVTGATGTSVTRSIDGGAFGSATGTLTEIANGIYQFDASAADMNGGKITFRFAATGGTPGAPDDAFVTVVTGAGV